MNSYVDGGAFARRTISAPCSAPGSPKSRVKFLCSHGGKIFPRPSDGQLKYVGGETRVISVPLDISFKEVMKRVTYSLIEGEMILKYQLVAEELDALVSVKCDEDVGHMFEEMELMHPRFMRTFLFPIHKLPLHQYLPKIQSSPSICNLQYSYHPQYSSPIPIPIPQPFHTPWCPHLDAAAAAAAYNYTSSTGLTSPGYCSNCMHHHHPSNFSTIDTPGTQLP